MERAAFLVMHYSLVELNPLPQNKTTPDNNTFHNLVANCAGFLIPEQSFHSQFCSALSLSLLS